MKRSPFAAFALVLVLVAPAAVAEWPVSRHDAQRTAIAGGKCDIAKPTQYWQRYLGGTLRGTSHLAVDVDKDGRVDVVYLAGGKAIAKLPDDRLVWESTPVELTSIHGVVDLDNDGALEVVASSARNVYVLDGKTGAILWREPDGEVGNVGGVRLADLDGDKTLEIVIDDCACCGISPIASPAGGVYKFEAGKLGTPTKLYAPLSRSHCGAQATTIGDFDGDGSADVAYGNATGYSLTTGKTGAALGSSDVAGETMYYASCDAANVDGRVGDELICFQDSYLATVGGGRRVAAFTYDPAAPTKVRTLWNVVPVPKATGELRWLGNSVVDLDGDGKWEVVFASHDGAGPWTTTVIDAKTGAELGKTGGKLVGLVDLDGDKKLELLTEPASGVGLSTWRFDRTILPAVYSLSDVGDFKVPYGTDWAKSARSTVGGKPLTIDLKGDGKVYPVFFQRAAGSTLASYTAYAFDAKGLASPKATYGVPDGIEILTNEVFANVNRSYPQLLLTRNDGFLLVLDDAFAPTNNLIYGTGEFKVTLPGMRVGGFLGEPIAPRLDGTADAPVVRDSRGTLLRLDPTGAWMSKPPAISWEIREAGSPTTVGGIDGGKPGLVCVKNDPVTRKPDTLLAVNAAGTKLWDRKMPDGTLTYDPLGGDVNGDGVKDVFAAWIAPGSVVKLQVHDGKTGAPIWGAPHAEALQWGFQPFSLADWNGDGVSDLYVVPNTLRVLNGATGAKLAENTTFLAYFTPTVADVDGDGKLDVTLSRGYFPARTLANDLVTQKWIGADDRPYPHGARGACSGGRSVWVQPSSQVQGMVRLVDMNGASVGTTKTVYLAGGKVFASAADAATDKKFLGTVGHVAVKQELISGATHPSALMGSTDGFLYAVDPCSGALDWSYDLKFAVGDPILADTSGDGVDEILVPAADGYLHAIGPRLLPAPATIADNDPYGAVPGPDVDTVKTKDTLAASWDKVPDADGYQVAIVTEGGTYVTQPDWVDVGAATDVKLKALALVNGKKYFAVVRAASKTKGSSVETRSNGVVVEIVDIGDAGVPDGPIFDDTGTTPGDAGADVGVDGGALGEATPEAGGCGCRTGASSGSAAALGALVLAGLAATRRRR